MLYPVRVITAALAAESLAVTNSAPTSNSNIGDSFGCSITLPANNEQVSIGSTVLISWIVEPNTITDDADLDVDLMQEANGLGNVVEKIKSKISSDTRSIAWYIDNTIPVDNGYYIRISSQPSMKCYGSHFAIQKFHGDHVTKMTPKSSDQRSPMVIPAGYPEENHRMAHQNSITSSSHRMDSNLTNLVAGLLVFGAFLWV